MKKYFKKSKRTILLLTGAVVTSILSMVLNVSSTSQEGSTTIGELPDFEYLKKAIADVPAGGDGPVDGGGDAGTGNGGY